jgi:hypothetical protein
MPEWWEDVEVVLEVKADRTLNIFTSLRLPSLGANAHLLQSSLKLG